MEAGLATETIESIAAEGEAAGLTGAALLKFALAKMGTGAAVVEAERVNASKKTSGVSTGYRTHNCAELRSSHNGQQVTLVGWVAKSRVVGQMLAFVDLRDRYGITQCVFQNEEGNAEANALFGVAASLGREYIIQIEGLCRERVSKNPKLPTG